MNHYRTQKKKIKWKNVKRLNVRIPVIFNNLFYMKSCSLHVYGNYWQTGRISRLIEIRASFTLHKQDKSSAAKPSYLSTVVALCIKLGITPSYFHLVWLAHSSCTEFTLCTVLYPLVLGFPSYILVEVNNLSLVNSLSNSLIGSTVLF